MCVPIRDIRGVSNSVVVFKPELPYLLSTAPVLMQGLLTKLPAALCRRYVDLPSLLSYAETASGVLNKLIRCFGLLDAQLPSSKISVIIVKDRVNDGARLSGPCSLGY